MRTPLIVSDLTGRKISPKKESGAQDRKRRAQIEAVLNESRKIMKKYFTSSGNAERQSADIRRQDESTDTDTG